jgi:hypothetical protein
MKNSASFERDVSGNGRHSTRTATIIYGVVKYEDIFGKAEKLGFATKFWEITHIEN